MIERSLNLNQKRNISKEKTNSLSIKSFSVSSFKTVNLSNNMQEHSKVVLRIIPKTEDESLESNKIFEIKDNNYIEFVGSKNSSKIFKFDYIFDVDSQQSQIFEICSKEICDSLFEGYNGTIFTYGQISSGKTYTMLGSDYSNSIFNNSNFVLSNEESKYISYMRKKEEEEKGLILRSIEYLLDKKEELCSKNKDINLDIEIFCSFYEIFNDQVYDLLNNSSWINTNQSIKEKGIEGNYKENLKKQKINDKKQSLELIKIGNLNRQSFSFIMNAQSRSHAVFSIYINISSKENNNNIINNKSILNLVDLAGRESKASTDNYGDKKDAGKINKSLLGLGNVIQNVGENFIPYRDTKLTFLLKDSLGNNPKTCFIATISPLKKDLQETLFTLNFAQNIKKIKYKINNKNNISKKNKLIEEEGSKIITKEDLDKELDLYNNYKNDIINLYYLLLQLGGNSQEVNKFKEKFSQNFLIKKNIIEDYENSAKILLNKENEFDELEKENERILNKTNNLSIELIVKEQNYNNSIKKQRDIEKEYNNIIRKLDAKYKLLNLKTRQINEKENILNDNEDFKNIINSKKQLIEEDTKIKISKNSEKEDLEIKITELENNIKSNSSTGLENQINDLKKEMEIININLAQSENDLLLINNKLSDKNKKLNNVDNILNSTQKLYKSKLLNNKGDIIKLNSIINQTSSNEIESKNKIFFIKNKISEYDIYTKILKKTKENLNSSLIELDKRNIQYRNELDEKINLYNNLLETKKGLINKKEILNKKFENIGGNKKNKENETKSKIIKLKEENNDLSKEVSHIENIFSSLYVKNNNIFQYHQNIDQKINEFKKIYNTSQKELIPIIDKNELRKSFNIIENIRNSKNLKDNEKLYLFNVSLENAICLLREKRDLIENMKRQNENIRLKTISSVRENNIKTKDFNLLNDVERRNSYNIGKSSNQK